MSIFLPLPIFAKKTYIQYLKYYDRVDPSLTIELLFCHASQKL